MSNNGKKADGTPPGAPPRGTSSVWQSGITLAVLAAICTALVAVTWYLTAPRIAANDKAHLEQSLEPALADVLYDSDVTASTVIVPPPHELPGHEAATIYRVYSGDKPVAAVFVVDAPNGYAGPIRLLIGIQYSGEISGVRVLQQHETPGLGDQIEATKSDWLKQFNHASLAAPPRDRWTIARDGGDFDQVSGASVTSRAVVNAIRETLLYFESHRDSLFETKTAPVRDEDRTSKDTSR